MSNHDAFRTFRIKSNSVHLPSDKSSLDEETAKKQYSYLSVLQWRSKGGGGQVGARALGRNNTFCNILNMFLSRNLDQSMLKMRIFWEKSCKNRLAPEPPFASGD